MLSESSGLWESSHNLTQPLLRKGEEPLWFEVGKPVRVVPSLGFFAYFAVHSQKSELLAMLSEIPPLIRRNYVRPKPIDLYTMHEETLNGS